MANTENLPLISLKNTTELFSLLHDHGAGLWRGGYVIIWILISTCEIHNL